MIDKLEPTPENDDEDYGNYFLQPASSPYNIAEKIQQANIDLYNNSVMMKKTSKVKFREELATFEPELTDDDVNSIESFQISEEIQIVDNSSNLQTLQYKTLDILNNTISSDSSNENDDNEEVEDFLQDLIDSENFESEEINFQSETPKNYNFINEKSDNNLKNVNKKIFNTNKNKLVKKSVVKKVECRNHCIEKLDFDLSMCIKKLEIQEKPINCPLLKLQQRQCCDEKKLKLPQKLPTYNGLRSEYGLSLSEIAKREKRKELIKLKEQKRQQLFEEYKRMKIEQNEKVFCQWLKDVAKRKSQQEKIDAISNRKSWFKPKVINFPNKATEKVKDRPKTANEFLPKHNIKRARRPHTTHSRVFIEIPHKLLRRGINVGDLLVADPNSLSAKKLHIMTIS